MTDATLGPLLDACRQGHPGAADALLRRCEPWLQLLAARHMESRLQAKFDPADVVQQTMVEAVRDFAAFRGTTAAEFLAWLRQILAHVLAHEVRRYCGTAKRDIARERSLDDDLSQTADRLDLLAPSGASPTRHLARAERQVLLARLLQRLPEADRTVLTLRHLEGCSHEEIARRLHRSPGAVRMLWVRALARLREAFLREGITDL